ncbi:MAG: MAC/perforin domain-containing protein, partial [Cyanobacteria bacterium J06621_11]
MKKIFRVYRAFLPGILIGLLFALLLSDNSEADIPKAFHYFQYIDQPILVLICSGILGGVLYTIVLDGYVELPRFKAGSTDAFEAGLFGDLLLGIAGAFVFDFLTVSLISPSVGLDATTGDISLKVIAAKGIIGGYGGRTLMETAHKKFLKRVESLESEKDSVIKENQELAQEVVELAEEKEQLIQGADLIGQLNEHVRNGLPEPELRVLTNSINAAPAPVKSQIFDISKELRSLSSRTAAMQPRTQRTIPIFETLVDSEPTNHEYHAQLAFALKDGVRPELSKALSHIDRAINLRGRLKTADDWKYELSRAVIQMQEKRENTGSFVSPPNERDQILRDLLAVSKKRDLAEILADAKRNNIDTPIVDWLMENRVWSDRTDHASSLVKQLKNVLQDRQSTIAPNTDGNIERVHTGPVLESIKRVLTEKVREAVPIDKLPSDALEALNIGLTQIGVLTPQTDPVEGEVTNNNGIREIEDAWRFFTQQHANSAENAHSIENGQNAESRNTSLVSPSSIGTLINALNYKFGEHQPRRRRSSNTTFDQFETTHTESQWAESQWVSSQPTALTTPTTITPAAPIRTDMSKYANFPKNFTFLGRCYDILTLDPFNTSESAKQYMVFHFSPDAGEVIRGENNLLKPKGSNYTPGASGGSSVNSRTQILHTASDTEALFANTLGGGILSLVSKILPFSNSFSYKKFKRARTEERSIYTVTKADYIDYTLSLPEERLSELPLDQQFVRAVEQLPTTPNTEQYKSFIEKFGTHVSTEVKFGGLAYRCIRLNETLYTELSQRGTNLQLEAGKLFNIGFSNQEQGVVEREISESSETFRVNGGRPSADWDSWFMSIQADPAPVKMELEPLYELLTVDFFPRDRQIEQKKQLMRDSLSAYFDRNADKPHWELWQSVALGSQRGKPFSDIDVRTNQLEENITKYQNARVREIKVWSDVCVNRIQMILTVGAAFDSHGGDKGREQSLLLSEGEYIRSIEVSEGDARASRFKTYHDCITYLKIVTSEGGKLEAGKRTGPLMSLDIPNDYQVIGFHGKSGWVLDSLGIIASPLPHLFADELTAQRSDSLAIPFSHKSGIWHSVDEKVLPVYSMDEVRSLLETTVTKEVTFSQWPPQLVQVVCVALIRLRLLKQSESPQVILKAWKTFKQRAHLANLETIGPSSVQSLLKAIERQSKPQRLSRNSSDIPILFDKPFPETGVQAPYKAYFNPVMGSVLVTGGFMEPAGHGYKSKTRKAIYRNGTIKTIHPGYYNIGFDYGKGLGQQVTC